VNVASYLADAAGRAPGHPAIFEGARVVDYAELHDRAARVAGLLAEAGVRPGDRVSLLLPNRAEFLEALFGTLAVGAVVVPIGTRLHPNEWEYALRNSGSAVLIHDTRFSEELRSLDWSAIETGRICVGGPDEGAVEYESALAAARHAPLEPRKPDDLAWLFYTSGTTGHPKGAMVTHGNLEFMTDSYRAEVYDAQPEDRALHAGPLTHGSGLWAISLTAAGATHVLPTSASFDPGEIFALIEEHAITNLVFLAPTMIKLLLDSPACAGVDCSTVRFVGYGGAPIHPSDLAAAIERWGYVLANIYGQGECPMSITMLSPADHRDAAAGDPRRLRSAGRVRGGISVTVRDEYDRELGDGETGEVCVTGPVVMQGYWQNEQATAEVFRNGIYHTGDLGRFDDAGFLYLLDRTKELVISGGSNIYPREVENALLQHEGVREVAVFGIPDRLWGESVVAVVVPDPSRHPTDDELVAICRGQLASYKKPRWIFYADELPRNPTGKVLKRELARHYASLIGAGAS